MLVYLHGFNSSPASHKAQLMKTFMESRGLGSRYAVPALKDTPEAAMQAIEQALAGRDPQGVTFIGSSLGGFYATYLVEKLGCRAVLINPAITPHIGLEAYLGAQKNLHTGA
ncbi:MAG TPA: YqiA/YcfP family alpha/beta fold hydrolase, partial [Burkholderiales bacterium]|nr:YqiA/YcfP family alpha/beta fold hydrolase [Burkholderiales bacterium]